MLVSIMLPMSVLYLFGADTSAMEAKASGASVNTTVPREGIDSAGRPNSRSGSDFLRDKTEKQWFKRWLPERNKFEVGAYGGVFLPGSDLELFSPNEESFDQGFRRFRSNNGSIGARVGYLPWRFLGIEAEGGIVPTEIQAGGRATIWAARGNLLGQLPFWRITPFVLVGSGVIAVASKKQVVGNDIDGAFHMGGGLKFAVNKMAQVRLDVRDIVGAAKGVKQGIDHSLEATLGVSVVLGRSQKPVQPVAAPPTPEPIPVVEAPVLDSDNDGFIDTEDKCIDEPGVLPDGCPVLDSDGDGVLDDVDRCLNEAGIERLLGCPEKDSDNDGIFDDADACVDKAETKNGFEDTDGCPDELPEEIKAFSGVIEGITFETSKSAITNDSEIILAKVVEVLKKYPELRLEIVGHTDSMGNYESNVALSRERAESVRNYLMEHGVDESRLSARGLGPDEPRSDNKTRMGRAKNRRIEFRPLN